MKKLQLEEFACIYKYIKLVQSSKLTQTEAGELLHQLHGNISLNSFRGYYYPTYKKMCSGEIIRGSIPLGLRKFFLDKIYEDLGKEGLILALASFRQTIEYYSSKKVSKKKDIILYEEYAKKI